MDLTEFYKTNDIVYLDDAIGNETWYYKNVVIARHIAVHNENTEVYFHWWVDKRNTNAFSLENAIQPVKKKHGKFYGPDGVLYNEPKGVFDGVSEKNIEFFKLALLSSVNILKKRYQVLKGKFTMLKKYSFSAWSESDLLADVSEKEYERIFKKHKNAYNIKLNNGVSLPIKKIAALNEKYIYVVIGKEAIHLIKPSYFDAVSVVSLTDDNIEFLKELK